MSKDRFEATEIDEAGNVTATYVQSPAPSDEGTSRFDTVCPRESKSLWQRGLDIFMPAGYPHSVTEDYLEYQIYDSLQAFTSSIASLLSSRAVLTSVGVGDASATPTAALLLTIVQESFGRLATIAFAARLGTALEPECKFYRLLADVLNDFAFVLDCLSPALPKSMRVMLLSSSSVLRALCGVAAGSAKASLSAHFARWGNLGELNAKDASQETVISLLGMLAGSVVVSWVEGGVATWTVLVLLLAVHLETNRRAVSAVRMRSLNRQRAGLVWRALRKGKVPTLEDIAKQERIFERDGVLRGPDRQILGYCTVGADFGRLLDSLGQRRDKTSSRQVDEESFSQLISIYSDQKYLLWRSKSDKMQLQIVIKKGATHRDLLLAWWHALAVAERLAGQDARGQTAHLPENLRVVVKDTLEEVRGLFNSFVERLEEAGWNLDAAALETTSSTRILLPN